MYIVAVNYCVDGQDVSWVYSKHDTIDEAQISARQALKDGYIDVSIEKVVPWHK